MSVRPIEVQGSLPQSQKTGKIQDQLQQRGQMSQSVIAQREKEAEQLRQIHVNKSADSEKARLHQDGQKKQSHHQKHSARKNEEDQKQQANHPHKGKFVDFSG